MKQFSLLTQRRFGPFFWTQFLGAFNDNFFKNALVILITYQSVRVGALAPEQMVALCSGLFILPFFLFSIVAGQLADRFAKDRVVRWTKLAELAIMAVAATGFLTSNILLLLAALFCMGAQSAFFGPAKYGILPELMEEKALVAGNALIQGGTFLAILLGTIAGGLLILVAGVGAVTVAGGAVLLAIFGYFASTRVPQLTAQSPDLRVSISPLKPFGEAVHTARTNRPVFLSILGVSWFWFVGASVLALFPVYVKNILHGNEHVVTLFLTLFSVGIAVGAWLCEKCSRERLELGLVPLGSIGMTLFLADLFFANPPAHSGDELLGLAAFLSQPASYRILADLLLVSIFGGFYIVPLQTLIQQRTQAGKRAQVIAVNNMVNSLMMVVSSVALMALYAVDFTPPAIFGMLALANVVVAVYIYTVIPEFLLRFIAWMLANVMYRIKVEDTHRIPAEGPAVIVCNHVSFVDWLLMAAAVKRPARFVMHHSFHKIPGLGWFFRAAKVIPIAPAKEDPEILRQAYDRIAEELENGQVVCIFPEGGITRDGRLMEFRGGIEHIVARTPVPVVPMAICGMWGSFFSRRGGKAMTQPFRRVWSRVRIRTAESVAPGCVKAAALRDDVAGLIDETVSAHPKVAA